jgi:hypothetical protein
MSLYRIDARRDANEPAIVQVLERRGYVVDRVSAKGFPDLVVSKHKQAWFVEIKQPGKSFTPAQVKWRIRWQGPTPITLRTVDEALAFPEIAAAKAAA